MTKAVFSFLKLKVIINPATAITMLCQPAITDLPKSKHTIRINATAATFTASRNADKIFDFRKRETKGLSNPTKKNEGRKMPKVANTAPGKPFIC